jgi:hypothetical protein
MDFDKPPTRPARRAVFGRGGDPLLPAADSRVSPIPPMPPTSHGDVQPEVPATPPDDAKAPDPDSTTSLPPMNERPMKPIGPAGLKALREAIKSGRYPSDAAVRAGIERLLRKPE